MGEYKDLDDPSLQVMGQYGIFIKDIFHGFDVLRGYPESSRDANNIPQHYQRKVIGEGYVLSKGEGGTYTKPPPGRVSDNECLRHGENIVVYHPAFTDDLGSMYLISRRRQRLSTGSILATTCVVFILLIPVVEAADDEDFTNNLFSDLAPILTLFGEHVTKPFMSESSGSVDSILLAMAPLGVITAIVSTIRVAGHPWLKALFGRVKEGLAQAELELMSSNSPDVGKMWNGQAVVRVLGKPSIFQFVHTPDTVAAAATTVSPTTSPENNTQAQPQQHPADSSNSQASYGARQGLVASVSPAVAVSPGMSTAQSDFVTKIDVLSGHNAFFERRGAKRSDERPSGEGDEWQDNSDIEMHLFCPTHPTLPIRWCSVNRTSQAMDIACWGNLIHGWDETDE